MPDDIVRRLKTDPDFPAEIRANKKRYSDETRTMADLFTAARAAGREIEPIPHPGADVFDLLDENVIRSQYPKFPGYEAAKAAAGPDRASSGKKLKDFYRNTYELTVDIETVVRLAVAMRQRNVTPHPALTALLEICERLAFMQP